MENFSVLSSIIIPVAVSLATSLITYPIAVRKQNVSRYNDQIDGLKARLDDIYHKANDIFHTPEYDDADYRFMFYTFDNLTSDLNDVAIGASELLELKILLTDKIFYRKEDNHLLSNLQKD